MKKILLGMTNQAKTRIIRAALETLAVEVITPSDLGIHIDVREDSQSTEENAKKKARTYFAESHIPTLAIDGGLHIEKFQEEKQPGVLVRRIYGIDRGATDEEVLQYYMRELDKIGGESIGIWRGSIVLVVSDEEIFSDTFTFKTLLTSRREGSMTVGAPLDALMIEPTTGKYYSKMDLTDRPDAKWVFEFVEQHIGAL